jgi:RNA polymerase sigma-70 factor (sigma-E family)
MRLVPQVGADEEGKAIDDARFEVLHSSGWRELSVAVDDSFSAWVQQHQRSLLAFAQLVSGDAHAAEDLVQGALAKAYLKWDRLRGHDQSPHAYVRRIIVNDNTSLWRRAWKRNEHSTERLPDRAAAAADPVDVTWALVQALPLRQRTAIALRFYADLSVADTAAAMGCSTGAVKTHTSRAVAALREALSKAGKEPTHD